jgi:penicillin amidase
VPVPIPGPEVVDLRTRSTQSRGPARRVAPPLLVPASNQWALSAQRGTRGGALLANDPHRELRLPNLFYRTELQWPDGAVRGVSIPGVPGVLLGATSTLAWGATVSNADQADWVVIDVDAHDPSRYVTPEGSEPFRSETFAIAIAGGHRRSSRSDHALGVPSSRATDKASRSRCTRPGSTRTASTSP